MHVQKCEVCSGDGGKVQTASKLPHSAGKSNLET